MLDIQMILIQRFLSHNSGKVKSTKSKRPLQLVYYEAYVSELDARRRELQIKNSSQEKEFLKKRIEISLKESFVQKGHVAK